MSTAGSALTRILCRDCLAEHDTPGRGRCPACGSPRLLSHPERDSLSVAHVDCDAFYAAVEKRDDPSLRDRPVIVGGGRRGVVSTACYVARLRGVASAMPMFKALNACPDAVVIRPDMAKYARVGREIRAMMLDLTPLVEPLSIDEAFLDLGGTQRLHGASPARVLARFARHVEQEVGITVSVGLSYCKFLAKLASEAEKPRGFSVIGRADALEALRERPVGAIWGVGRVAQAKLAAQGIRLIGDLQALPERECQRRYGAEGGRLWRLAHGVDDRPVSPERKTQGISAETTLEQDTGDHAVLIPILYGLCDKVSRRLKAQDVAARSVTLKLKTSGFQLITRSRSGLPATQLRARLFAAARELLARLPAGAAYRLVGVGASDLVPSADADRGDLVDTRTGRERAVETAVDRLRERFGSEAVISGITFGADHPGRAK